MAAWRRPEHAAAFALRRCRACAAITRSIRDEHGRGAPDRIEAEAITDRCTGGPLPRVATQRHLSSAITSFDFGFVDELQHQLGTPFAGVIEDWMVHLVGRHEGHSNLIAVEVSAHGDTITLGVAAARPGARGVSVGVAA